MKNTLRFIFVCGIGAFALTGCDSISENLGYSKRAPDEFAVYRRAPLSLPPSYALRPPSEAGKDRPGTESMTTVARRSLLSQSRQKREAALAEGRSLGEQSLLRRLGALDIDPNIRRLVNRETSIYIEEDKEFTDKLLFWKEKKPFGDTVDALKENKRIQEGQALGKEIDGKGTPSIGKKKKKGLLEGLFD
ncbi:MAG: DUF3035 domain-containing protein [Rhodospirillales bacterium]|nr:DUF3035 domain-containing protein [Rhodospirillales bacterium]